jgi:hypothetical protein
MISVGDAVLKITGDSTDLDKALKDVDSKIKSSTDSWAKNMRIAGAVMTSVGTGITGAMVLSAKAAAEEDVGIQRLAVAMKNVGLTYDGANGSLEKWLDTMMQATGYEDSEQRDALSSLIILTGDLTKAQNLLTLAMDLARWKNIDLGTASDIITKVYAGNMGTLARYGIIVKEGSTATEALAQIQQAAAGQAETYGKTVAGQFDILKNSFGEVSESIGGVLIPILSDLFKQIMPVINSVRQWMVENPGLTKTIVIIVAAIGGLLMVLGPLLMILPGLITALPLLGAAFTIATGPVGWIIAAIAALIAIGILLWKNWDTISIKAKEIWGDVVNFFKGVWNMLISGFENYVNFYVNGINMIIGLINKIPGVNIGKLPTLNLSGIKAEIPSFQGFQGIIPGVPGTPMLAMVHAGEYIGQGGGNTVNIYNPSVRSDQDITEITKQVSREMYRMQQVRHG